MKPKMEANIGSLAVIGRLTAITVWARLFLSTKAQVRRRKRYDEKCGG